MASIEEIRVALSSAKESLPAGPIEQARLDFEQVATMIAQATEGSSNSEIVEAAGQARQGVELMQQAHGLLQMLEQSIDGYAGRL